MVKKPLEEVVVFTSGTWDLWHEGHLNLIRRSRELGDRLIVAVSTDELVESYKECKPVVPFEERFRIVQACRYVDRVIVQTKLTNIRDLKKYRVNIITIGSDWRHKYLKGLEWAKRNGIKVVYLPYTKSVSTSGRIKEIIDRSFELAGAQYRRGIARIY